MFIQRYYQHKGILGVCLGHEAIAVAFGGEIHHSGRVFHGLVKRTKITEPGHYVFKGIPDGFEAGLYHSWIVKDSAFPQELKVTARAEDGVIMALAHRTYNLVGFQYHPESIMTKHGREMIINWLQFSS
jgi:anthranilate synthase component 2